MAKISVIIPCYNQEEYIGEAIESVLSQTFNDFEVIIVNDGSTDKSLNIIKKYVDKYSFIHLIDQNNQGVIASRNTAINMAQGKYIYPLDADDKIAPNCLEKLYQSMINNKGDVIYCDGNYLGNKTGKIIYLKPTKLNMSIGNRVIASALYRKSDWERYDGYDEIMNKGLEDWEFWLNFVEENKRFYKVDEPLFFYRISASSRNQSISKKTEKELFETIRKKHKKLFGWKFKIQILLIKIFRIFYQKGISKSGRLYIKILKIPVYRRKINE